MLRGYPWLLENAASDGIVAMPIYMALFGFLVFFIMIIAHFMKALG